MGEVALYNEGTLKLIKKPSAWMPLVMSAAALVWLVGYAGMKGIQEPTGDEGLAARVFQLLLAGQLPVGGYLAIRYFRDEPKQVTLIVLGQILAALVPVMTVIILERGL